MRWALVAVLLLVAGCDTLFPTPRSVSAPTTPSVVSDNVRTRMDAVEGMVSFCGPAADAGCDWDRFSWLVTDATTAIRTAVEDSPNPHENVNLTVLADDLDSAVAAFAPCAERYDSTDAVGCDQDWTNLIVALDAVERAIERA